MEGVHFGFSKPFDASEDLWRLGRHAGEGLICQLSPNSGLLLLRKRCSATHSKLARQVDSIRLVDLLPARQNVLKLIMIRLMYLLL